MNNLDSHPRVLSLGSGSSEPHSKPTSIVSTTPSTPMYTPFATTPINSRRGSMDSQHAAHHFINMGKTDRSLGSSVGESVRKLWRGVKEVAREHHRSVNAAYEATHGSGVRGLQGVRV